MAGQPPPLDTVRLNETQRQRLVDDINRAAGPVPAASDRRRLRVAYNPGHVQVSVAHPSGQVVQFQVVPRNLSALGVAFLHGGFVHGGSLCQLRLRQRDGEVCQVHGRVVNCRHVAKLIHEVAVRFDAPIDLTCYVELDELQRERWRREANARPTVQALITLQPGSGQPDVVCLLRPGALDAERLTFTHGLHPAERTPAQVTLFGPEQGHLRVTARVAACEAVSSVAQRITLRFDRPANVSLLHRVPGNGRTPAASIATTDTMLVVHLGPADPEMVVRLNALGGTMVIAANQEQLLQALRRHTFNLMLVDAADQLEEFPVVLDLARRSGFAGWIVAAAATSADDGDAQACALAIGANAFLATPFPPARLEQAITRLLRHGRPDRVAA